MITADPGTTDTLADVNFADGDLIDPGGIPGLTGANAIQVVQVGADTHHVLPGGQVVVITNVSAAGIVPTNFRGAVSWSGVGTAAVTTSPARVVAPREAVTLAARIQGEAPAQTYPYVWTVTSGGAVVAEGAGQEFVFTPPEAGVYEATVTAGDAAGNIGRSATTVTARDLLVTTTADAGFGSLRQALIDANAAGGGTIRFNLSPADANFVDVDSGLPGGDAAPDVWVFRPLSELPFAALPGAATLDGSDPASVGYDLNPCGPEVVLDGGLLPPGATALSAGYGVLGVAVIDAPPSPSPPPLPPPGPVSGAVRPVAVGGAADGSVRLVTPGAGNTAAPFGNTGRGCG